ncbi:hypothetical protein MG293_006545 [Ovis ammon polii]|uniref:G-protein coupled receptors family 1 profile domain-containing protein n=1 Tax=Ovis ammon polii TaxID=230172 RepID=A0AAD4UEP1_OVIAM|nr:hypothetical protein MG293_006545 [Ovis ammon polii]
MELINVTTLSNASNTELSRCDRRCRIILLSLYSVVLLGGAAGAIAMSYMMLKRNSQSIVATIVLNIIVLHSILLFSLPFRLSYYVLVVWEFGSFTCRLVSSIIYGHMYFTFVFYVAIIISRLLMYFKKLQTQFQKYHVVVLSIIIWMVGSAIFLPIFFLQYGTNPSYSEQQCFEFYKDLKREEFIILNYSMIVIMMTTVVILFLIQMWVIVQLLSTEEEVPKEESSGTYAVVNAVINSQSLWDEMMQNKGLTVIDVYQAWCGPCKAMQTLFRKLKNELNEDELLHFAVNGTIVAKIQGANAPLVNQKILTLVDEERKIAADQIYTIVIIKPDAVAARKVQEIKEKIIKAGFVIEAEDKKPLTEEQVKHFYSKIVDQPDFEDFVSFMTRNLSYILVVSQGKEKQSSWDESEVNSETESKEPWDDQQEMAKSSRMKERKSLQQYLEIQQISQFCDVEENITNTKFIDVLIPDFKKIRGVKFEKILALLRPALFNERTEDVLNKIQDEGFKILLQRQIVLSEEEAKTLCKEYENKDYFGNVIESMTSGPSLALVLVRENGLAYWKQLIGPSSVEEAKEYIPERGTSLVMILTKWNAVSDWRRLMGPTDPEEARLLSPDSIRAQFGENILKNAVHGPSDMEEAMKTISSMFEDFVPENLEEN